MSNRSSSKQPLLEQPAFTSTRKIRLVCIGAGFAGMLVAHKVQHELKLENEIELVIYDRNPEIGGTWFENTYPGAACDIPSHAYIFPFEGNPEWTKFYVDQKEILSYIQNTAEKYGLTKHVRLNTTITQTVWDEASGQWEIQLQQGGETKEDRADFLINASGFLNKWKWPQIHGLFDFKGKLLHSAKWDNTYEWRDKRVAVIGNGASGIQLVASMQPDVAELVNYVRQPTWISVNFLAEKTPDGINFEYSDEQKKIWRDDPRAHFDYRRDLEKSVNAFFFAMCLDSPAQPFFEGDGYLEALQQSNCTDCWDEIERVTEEGIQTAEGVKRFDLIVCATGFDSSWLPQWRLVGRDGATLESLWKDDPQAFYASMINQMPNYAMINGPNPPISHGSVIQQMSWTADFIMRWVKYMNRHDIKSICVKEESVKDFNEYSQEFLKRTVWSGECRTIYKNGRSLGRTTGVYAGSMTHFQKGLEEVGGEHFDIKWRSANRFRCLGNGTTETDQSGSGDLAPYFAKYAPIVEE